MIITLITVICFIVITLWRIQYKEECIKEYFFSKNYTTVLKGLSCIVVIFVHIPLIYTNKIQDLVGSFAYICVTLFFMFSAYGIQKNFKNEPNYKNNFLKNRILVLLIPYSISCIIKALCGFGINSGGTKFIYVLIIFYFVSYVVHELPFIRGG